ncbi:MAG TPA: dihydrodipicolinate synthase family protein [Acidisarcina sp.]|nr:dihydrodipicolinate synthase family protein [Acidisarcina sp.]
MSELHGIFPALVTPANAAGEFEVKPFEKLLERVYQAGVQGVYVCGQTGEGFQLSLSDRQIAAESAVRCSPKGATVIVHVGAPATHDAVALTKHAAKAGAHLVSSLPPVGNYSFEEIRSYYTAIAQASELPLMIYYFPSMSPAIRTTEQILELCAIPNVMGLKFTDSDFFRLWSIRQTGTAVFNGSDEMLLSGLVMGASGGIGSTYNLIPESFVELYQHASAGRWEEARLVQNKINEFIQVLLKFPIHPVVKQILLWTGIDCGTCILPRRSLTLAEQKDLRESVAETELGRKLLALPAMSR